MKRDELELLEWLCQCDDDMGRQFSEVWDHGLALSLAEQGFARLDVLFIFPTAAGRAIVELERLALNAATKLLAHYRNDLCSPRCELDALIARYYPREDIPSFGDQEHARKKRARRSGGP